MLKKPEKYILQGERNVRYHDRILTKKRNLSISHNFFLKVLLELKIYKKLHWPTFLYNIPDKSE